MGYTSFAVFLVGMSNSAYGRALIATQCDGQTLSKEWRTEPGWESDRIVHQQGRGFERMESDHLTPCYYVIQLRGM